MSSPGSMTRWAEELRSPEARVRDEAARRIWERYSAGLLALVRRNLDERIRRREDEDDVLQSLYQSFCRGRQVAEEPLRSRDEIWRLLVHIALCKVANTVRRHRAACRDVRRERTGPGEPDDLSPFPDWVLEQMGRSEPSPEEAQILEEEMQQWLGPLPEDLRRVALWKLEGYTNKEIGVLIGRTGRTVELKLHVLRELLAERLVAADPPASP